MTAPIGLNQVAMPAAAASSSSTGATFPLSGYGLKGASLDPSSVMGSSNLANNQAFFQRLYFPTGPVTNVYVAVRGLGTWDGATLGSGLYVYTDAGVLIDSYQAGGIFTAEGWVGGALSLGPTTVPVGAFGYIAVYQRGYTVAPGFPFLTSASDASGNLVWYNSGPSGSGANHRRTMYQGGIVTAPASFDPTSYGTPTTFTMLVAYN